MSHWLYFVRSIAGMMILSCIGLQADAADLLEIYHLAQANDPTFEVARHGFEAAQEKFPQARAGNLPTVSLNANRNFTDAKASFNDSTPEKQGIYAWTWTLQLTQPIMRPQNILAYYESEALVESAAAEFAQAEQDMILRVAQAYFDSLIAQETVASAEAQLHAMQEQEVVAKRGFELGTVSITDSHEARSKAEQARAQLIAAKNDLEIKLTEIERLTGKPIEMLARLKPAVVTPRPEPFDVMQWVDQAKDNNPLVRAQFSALRAAGYTVTKARAENFWTLDFVGSYGANYSSGNLTIPTPYETRVKSSVAGIQFSMPIFAGGLNNSHMRESIANQSKLSAQLEEARRKAGADAKQAYAGIVNGVSQTEALQSAVDSGESSVKGNQAGYKLGLRINSDVLNAQQQLFVSKRDLAKARYDTLFAGLKLKAAAGVLSEDDLKVINGLLEH
jgi:outer membrane protein